MSTVEDRIRVLSEITVILPELQEAIVLNIYMVRDMLETGLGGRIRDFKRDSENAEHEARVALQEAKDLLVMCSVKPKIVYEKTTRSGYLSIQDIPNGDITSAVDQAYTTDDSRFFGTNRTAFGLDSEKYARVIDNQQRRCHEIDGICARYGINPLDIERWTVKEMTRVLSVYEGAKAWRDAHPPEKDK